MSTEVSVIGENEGKSNLKKMLSKAPDPKEIKKHPFLKIDYIPIDIIESKLDIYFKKWDVVDLEYNLVGNSMCVSLVLVVFDKTTGAEYARRSGVAAIALQTDAWDKSKGRKPKGYDIDPNNIKAAALQMALPVSKATALKNAAASLGNDFGRSLNRNFEDTSLSTLTHLEDDLNNAKDKAQLNLIFNKLPKKYQVELKDLYFKVKERLENEG